MKMKITEEIKKKTNSRFKSLTNTNIYIVDTEDNLIYVLYLGRSRSPSPKGGRKGKSDSPTPNTDLGKGKLTVNDLSKVKKALRIIVSVGLVTQTQSSVNVLYVVRS